MRCSRPRWRVRSRRSKLPQMGSIVRTGATHPPRGGVGPPLNTSTICESLSTAHTGQGEVGEGQEATTCPQSPVTRVGLSRRRHSVQRARPRRAPGHLGMSPGSERRMRGLPSSHHGFYRDHYRRSGRTEWLRSSPPSPRCALAGAAPDIRRRCPSSGQASRPPAPH